MNVYDLLLLFIRQKREQSCKAKLPDNNVNKYNETQILG